MRDPVFDAICEDVRQDAQKYRTTIRWCYYGDHYRTYADGCTYHVETRHLGARRLSIAGRMISHPA